MYALGSVKNTSFRKSTILREYINSSARSRIKQFLSFFRNCLFYYSVRSLINQSYVVPNTPEMENDLRSIAEALFENMKDKNLTIIHQRKINKYV